MATLTTLLKHFVCLANRGLLYKERICRHVGNSFSFGETPFQNGLCVYK